MIDKAVFKQKVEDEILKHEARIEEYKALTQPIEPDCAIGRVSRMDAINNKSVTESALRESIKKVAGLKYMLSTIDNDDFGLCAKCKTPVPEARMLAVPQSRFCVHCAQ